MATKKTKTKLWMEDGDDAHFSDNPAVPKKHHAKKRIKAASKGHPAVKVTKKPSGKSDIPYGITKGEYYGKGSTEKWKHGRYRKQAEKAYAGYSHEYETPANKEDNIREKQAHLKNEDAWNKHEKDSKKRVAGPKTKSIATKPQTRKKVTRKRVSGK